MINIFVLVTILGHLPVILSAKSKGSENMEQILIVEDDSFLNKMLAYNLTADGYGVTSALNARTAAEAIRQREFAGQHLPGIFTKQVQHFVLHRG